MPPKPAEAPKKASAAKTTPATISGFNGTRRVPPPVNEPVKSYAPGSPERAELKERLESMKNERCEGAACATTAMFADHSHMSAVFAPNTADDSVTAPLLQWMAAVP